MRLKRFTTAYQSYIAKQVEEFCDRLSQRPRQMELTSNVRGVWVSMFSFKFL